MAVGATIVIISGGIDLSVGSIYALAGRGDGDGAARVGRAGCAGDRGCSAWRSRSASACSAASINGLMVVGLGVHPFIITLGTMWILRGIAFVASNAESILLPAALTRDRQGVARPGAVALSGADAGDARGDRSAARSI